MKEKYGTYPKIKEKHRDEIAAYVFDNRDKAGGIFKRIEQKYLKIADEAVDALEYLKGEGIEISVVSTNIVFPLYGFLLEKH